MRSKVRRRAGAWRRVHQQCPVSRRRLPWKRKMERMVSLESLRVRQTQNKRRQKNVTSRRRSFLVAVLCVDGVSVSRQHDGRPYCHKPCYAALFGPKGKIHPLPLHTHINQAFYGRIAFIDGFYPSGDIDPADVHAYPDLLTN